MPNFIKHKLSDLLFQKRTCYFLLIFGVFVRLELLPVKTGDSVYFLAWIDFIKTHGYLSSLKYNFYDYTPSYIYILILLSKIGLNSIYSIKIASIAFEYLAAFFIGKIAFLKYKTNLVIWACIAIIPLLPSVMLNSSYLSQCDSIYAAFVFGSIYFALTKKQLLSVLFLGIAFSFKIQAAIILPFYFVMMLRNDIKWYYFSLVPVVFVASILPAWLYGRPFAELITIYVFQSNYFEYLTMNFPNPYMWISNDFYEPTKTAGLILTTIITLLTGFWLRNKKYIFDFEMWVKLAFLSAIFIPFILPGMHERYMYMGDILGVLYFFTTRKNIHLSLGIILVSFYSYIRCSRYNDILPMEPALIIYLLVIIFVSADFVKSLKTTSNETVQ